MEHPPYSRDEIIQRGEQLYQSGIREKVERGNTGKILVIDVDTGEYEIDEDHLRATRRALAKHPGAVLYSLRIGYPSLGKMGGGWTALQR